MIGAYWGSRQETAEECADRLSFFFSELKSCDPSLAVWHERGHSRKEALAKQVEIDERKNLIRLLEKGRNRRDVGGAIIEELGFRVGLWSQFSEKDEIGLSITCGLYWQSPNQSVGISNHVILELPQDLGRFEQPKYTSCVLAAVATAWKPAWAGVMSRRAMNSRGFDAKSPFVDWMLYVPRSLDGVQPPSSIIEIPGGGSIVLVQPMPPSGEDPDEVQRASQIRGILSKAAV
jgi:hypothetical protein